MIKNYLIAFVLILLVGCELGSNVETISSIIENVSTQNHVQVNFEYSTKQKLTITINDKTPLNDAFLLGKILFEIDQQLLNEKIEIKQYLIRCKKNKELFLRLDHNLLNQIQVRKKKAEEYIKLYSQNPEDIIYHLNDELIKNEEIVGFFKKTDQTKKWNTSKFEGFNIYPFEGTNYVFFEYVITNETLQICLNLDKNDNDIYGFKLE